jgi:hypothetical protein
MVPMAAAQQWTKKKLVKIRNDTSEVRLNFLV